MRVEYKDLIVTKECCYQQQLTDLMPGKYTLRVVHKAEIVLQRPRSMFVTYSIPRASAQQVRNLLNLKDISDQFGVFSYISGGKKQGDYVVQEVTLEISKNIAWLNLEIRTFLSDIQIVLDAFQIYNASMLKDSILEEGLFFKHANEIIADDHQTSSTINFNDLNLFSSVSFFLSPTSFRDFTIKNLDKGEYNLKVIHNSKILFEKEKGLIAAFDIPFLGNLEEKKKILGLSSVSDRYGIFEYIGGGRKRQEWYEQSITFNLSESINTLSISIYSLISSAEIKIDSLIFFESTLITKNIFNPIDSFKQDHLKLNTNSIPALNLDLSHKIAKDIKVAVILDEFSFNSFKDEFVPIVLEPSNWKRQLEIESPDLFFCESAWSGVDSKTRPWKGKVYASSNFPKENRTELLGIIEYCNQQGIPTIFWNKEDPTHYPDRIHDFVKTAGLFDFVFTTAEECVEKYKSDYNLKNVFSLPFATNPKLFNPIENNGSRSSNVVFAGSWYSNHAKRTETMTELFNTLINNNYNIDFYNRYYNDNDPNHQIPDSYKIYEKPSVSNQETALIYKSCKFGLNINTVTDSETMFARRVFELMSSNTLVISNYSTGIKRLFGSNVIFLDREPDRLSSLTEDDIDHIRENNLNEVLKNHTYKKRFEKILDSVGVKYNRELTQITFVVLIKSRDQLILERGYFLEKYVTTNKKITFIIADSISDLDVAALYAEFNDIHVNVVAQSYIKRYAKSDFNCIETPYFILIDSLEKLDPVIVEKTLLHSSYLNDEFISLLPHKDKKYIFEESLVMNNIFAFRESFMKVIKNFNEKVNERVFYVWESKND